MVWILVILLALPIGLVLGLYFAWVASILWGWFITPVFGIEVTILQLYGIMLVVSLLRPTYNSIAKEKPENQIAYYMLSPLLTLGVGYIVKFWLM